MSDLYRRKKEQEAESDSVLHISQGGANQSETILDSGNRREFETGAIRDIQEDKGRCDLLPLDVVGELINSIPLILVEKYIRTGNERCIYDAIRAFADEEDKDIYTMMLEVAQHYEAGAKKYSDRNWEKGMGLHYFISSGVRHYNKHRRGDKDEFHDRAFVWNMLSCVSTQKRLPDMIDLPFKAQSAPDKPASELRSNDSDVQECYHCKHCSTSAIDNIRRCHNPKSIFNDVSVDRRSHCTCWLSCVPDEAHDD